MPRKPRKTKQTRSTIKPIEICYLQHGTDEGGPDEEEYLEKHPELLEPQSVIVEDDKDDDRVPT